MKKGFTLAEVLITLGIIGVVAALTLPSLIQNYREQATVTRVKKFYSVFSQAYAMAVLENGTIDNWGLKNSALEENENSNDGSNIHNQSQESFEQYDKFLTIMSKYLNKAGYEKLHNVKVDGENTGYILADGTQIVGIWLQPENCNGTNTYCGDFYIKTDNKAYYDKNNNFNPNIFAFRIEPNRIYPFGTDNTTFKNQCLTGKNYSRCTGWVIMNGNMDYLHCNDLSINGKTKCK